MSLRARAVERIGIAWLLWAVVLVLLATLPPQPDWPGAARPFMDSLRLPRSRGEWFDVAQNVALYLPLGLVLAARGVSWRRALAAAFLLSLSTELLQCVIPGRDAAARDVAVNAAGALVGYCIWWSAAGRIVAAAVTRVDRWVAASGDPSRSLASKLSLAWSAGICGAFLLTAALLGPAPSMGGLWVVSPLFDSTPGALRMGSNGTPGGYFRGLMDEVRIFNRAREPAQIAEDMRRPAGVSLAAEPSLVAAYSFDADAGATATDDSGHHHDGALRGAAWTSQGYLNGALSFDGVSGEVIVPHAASFDLRDGMTLEAWVNPSEEQTPEPALISRAGNLFYLDQSSSQGRFHPAAGGRFGNIPDYALLPWPVSPSTWTHLAATYDGQALRLYVNGRLASTQVHWSPHRHERVEMNGVTLTDGDVADADALAAFLLGPVNINTSVRCGDLSNTSAPVFLIAGLRNTHAFALNAAGANLTVTSWTWSRQLHLASPSSRAYNVFAGCSPGQTMVLTLSGRLQNLVVARDGQVLPTATPGLGSGWAFVFDADLLPRWLEVAATCLGLALMGAPLGFWTRRTALSAAAILLVAGSSLAAPYVLHVRNLKLHEVGALLAGGVCGLAVRRFQPGGARSSIDSAE